MRIVVFLEKPTANLKELAMEIIEESEIYHRH
jgi:hypothetical protein